MLDSNVYEQYKNREKEVFNELAPGGWDHLSLSQLVQACEQGGTTLTAERRKKLRQKLSKARSIRADTLFSFISPGGFLGHFVFLGALSMINARLSKSKNTEHQYSTRSQSADPKDTVSQKLNVKLTGDWVANSHNAMDSSKTLPRESTERLRSLLEDISHLPFSGLNVRLASVLSLVVDSSNNAQLRVPKENTRKEHEHENLESTPVADITDHAVISEICAVSEIIFGLWTDVKTVERAASTIVVVTPLWQQIRLLINTTYQRGVDILKKLPTTFRLKEQLDVVYMLLDEEYVPLQPQYWPIMEFRWTLLYRSHLQRGLVVDCKEDGIAKLPSFRFAFALLLKLEHMWDGPTKQKLFAAHALNCGYETDLARYLSVERGSKKEIFSLGFETHLDYWSYCCHLADSSAHMYDRCMESLIHTHMRILAHGIMYEKIRLGRATPNAAVAVRRRLFDFVTDYRSLLFWKDVLPKTFKDVDDSLLFWLDTKNASQKAELARRRLEKASGYPSRFHLAKAHDYNYLLKKTWLPLACATEVTEIEIPHMLMVDVYRLMQSFEPADLRSWVTKWKKDTTGVFEPLAKYFSFSPRVILQDGVPQFRFITFDHYKKHCAYCRNGMKEDRWDKFPACAGKCQEEWTSVSEVGLSQFDDVSLIKYEKLMKANEALGENADQYVVSQANLEVSKVHGTGQREIILTGTFSPLNDPRLLSDPLAMTAALMNQTL